MRREQQSLQSSVSSPTPQRVTQLSLSGEGEMSGDAAKRSSTSLFSEDGEEGEEEGTAFTSALNEASQVVAPSPARFNTPTLERLSVQPLASATRPVALRDIGSYLEPEDVEILSPVQRQIPTMGPEVTGSAAIRKSERDRRMRPFLEQLSENRRKRAKMILERVLDAPSLDINNKTGEVIAINPVNGDRVRLVGSNIATVLRKLTTVNRASTPIQANTYKGLLSVLRALARTNFDPSLIVNRDFQKQLIDLRENKTLMK